MNIVKSVKSLFFLTMVAAVSSCGPLQEIQEEYEGDLEPPMFLSLESIDDRSLLLEFDEEVKLIEDSLFIDPPLAISDWESLDQSLIIQLAEGQEAGRQYCLEASVEDDTGNSLSFLKHFYGHNPDIPELLINEFITQGSGNHPDLVELFAVSGGNPAGVCLYRGTPSDWDSRMVLPELSCEAGDYILIHFKPEGIASEVDETRAKDESGGLDASDDAWDFWVPDGSGLSGNNDVLSLCSSPGGAYLDTVIYSNRTSASDEDYRGFGSLRMMARVDEVVAAGCWEIRGELAAPEDAVNPEDSTSTRSICRSSSSVDTDSNADWHIVPTRGSTFGIRNIDDVYQ